ncbi:hypothetical protein GIB67_025861 [Kingdonia uniflora]|uniref:Uncharacterized protein n=1 Tax=Kingdonia uniflora TaxID=39325 RepID=A0A7J7MD62_9MAGN|nr:hypothetical protein GIB67_025861 [Kingdonia uniflora]
MSFLYGVCHNQVYLNETLSDIRLSRNLFLIQSPGHLPPYCKVCTKPSFSSTSRSNFYKISCIGTKVEIALDPRWKSRLEYVN